jgi:plastocyanin
MHVRSAATSAAKLLAALLVLPLALAACGDDGGGSTAQPSDKGAQEEEVTIVAKDFSLTSVTAKPGEEVYVDNQGDAAHTVTADEGAFDTGNVAGGDSAELTAPTDPGEYAYHCSIHPSMTGTLTVAA